MIYDDIIFVNRGEAETALSDLDDILHTRGYATVKDLYDLV